MKPLLHCSRFAHFSMAAFMVSMGAHTAFAQKVKPAVIPTPVPMQAASPEQLVLAQRVHTGRIHCELGATVAVLTDASAPGWFIVTTAGKQRYRMMPVATTTGAIRLEDRQAGGVWLQLANKSMLLDEKHGKRLADECATDEQRRVAESFKTKPPVSVLDAPAAPAPAAQQLAAQPAAPTRPQ